MVLHGTDILYHLAAAFLARSLGRAGEVIRLKVTSVPQARRLIRTEVEELR